MTINMSRITIGHTAAPDPIGDVLRADAIAYYKLDETSGARADATGRGNGVSESNGTISSVSGKVINAAHFVNASQSWLTRASTSDLQITTSATFAFWMRSDLSAYYVLMGKWNNPGGDREYLLDLTAGYLTWYVQKADNSGNVTVQNNFFGPISSNMWYFIVTYYDAINNLIGISVNGTTFDTVSLVGGARASGVVFDIGGNTAYAPGTLGGDIDEFGRWNKILSGTDIAYLYNGGTGRALF
jgi:hypothetical protein